MSCGTFCRGLATFVALPFLVSNLAVGQSVPKPLRASQVMALEAGGALQANIAHDITVRGLNFHPDDAFVSLVKKAGADRSVLAALKLADVEVDGAPAPDPQLLEQLSDAAVLIRSKQYAEAGAKLNEALDASFARMETGFVMAELMRQQEKFDVARSVYGEILEKEPGFPEVHTKASFLFYRVGDVENALNEAKAALAENPNDAEAHKNAGLALEAGEKPEAAESEYEQALHAKPDYAVARYDLGNLYLHAHRYNEAIVEYKKCLALNPKDFDAHTNLGLAYNRKGDVAASIGEFRAAKRLQPSDPAIRQNLASALMTISPGVAVAELRELEQKFPDFAMCHICLGKALAYQGDIKGAEEELRKADTADPADPAGHRGLGDIREKQKNYDAALEEYRLAEKIRPDDSETHRDIGRVLLAQKDFADAAAELKQAEALAQSSWEVHELYGQALEATGQNELAAGEFKEAVALNPTRALLRTELGGALEKQGDWVAALEQYRKAVLTDSAATMKAVPGKSFELCGKECSQKFRAAQGRFADHLVSLKAAGKSVEAAELAKKVAALDTNAGTPEKVQLALKAGDRAFQQRKIDEAEKQYKEAVRLAQTLPPGNDDLIAALGRLGNAYGMRQDFAEASATFHQQLTLVEQTFGPESEKSVDPLRFLGQLAAWQKNYTEAEAYLQRALAITTKASGDNDPRAVDSLRNMAGLYMAQNDWPRAETYLLRAVKGAEIAAPQMELIPLWGLCDMYDRAGNPEKSQPCWHQATDLMTQQMGQNSPRLAQPMTNEATALRKLGRSEEALKIEQRVANIQAVAGRN